MKLQPVLIVGLDGQSPVQPVEAGDLATLAQDSTLQLVATEVTAQAILAALNLQTQASTKATQATFNMALLGGYADAPVPLGTLTKIRRVKVSSITGAPTGLALKMNANTEAALDLNANSDWTDLDATALFFSGNQTANSIVTLQMWGE